MKADLKLKSQSGRAARHQVACGISLVEALIALAIVSMGMFGLLRVQDSLRLGSEASRHRGEALRLAQQALEGQRAFATLSPASGLRDYASVADSHAGIDSDTGFQTNTRYEVNSRVVNDSHQALKRSHIEVGWKDSKGHSQSLQLHSMLAGQDPALAVALGQSPRQSGTWGAWGRSSSIPPRAKNLGDGRSAFKPLSSGSVVWVFDNESGLITATCDGAPLGLIHGALGAEGLGACNKTKGLLLSGIVRFSLATPPSPESANDLPLPMAVDLRLTRAPSAVPPLCLSEAVKEIRLPGHADSAAERVPLDATPRSLGLVEWIETGERFVSYHCLVDVPGGGIGVPPAWSGRSEVVASGWRIGVSVGSYRICRYSSDADRSGAIDRNQEHPSTYSEVQAALNQQHFLVIRGELLCPLGSPIKADGVGEQIYVDWSTVHHQP